MNIEFENEIVMFDGIEIRTSGSVDLVDGYVTKWNFDHIIETGRPNDSIALIHLSNDQRFQKVIERKIDRLFPRYS